MASLSLDFQKAAEMARPTALDNLIAKVSPGWGAQRLRARREFSYEAAVSSRLRTSATRLQGPEDYRAFPERLQLIRQIRDLADNFGLIQSILNKFAIYAFGNLRYQARTGDSAKDNQYDEYLTWKFGACDLSGRFNLRSMVCVAFKSMLMDGDFMLKWQRDASDNLKLIGIEGDKLGGVYMTSADENYFQGITVDLSTGAPISYRVYHRTKANVYINPVEVPASDAIHIFDPRRVDSYRGVTPFAAIANEVRDLKELLEALRIGTKFENMHAAIIYTANGLPLNDPSTFIQGNETTINGAPITEEELKYGKIQHAPTGSKVEFLNSSRPAGTLQSYIELLIRLIGGGLDLPFGFLYDLSGLGGPAARMDSQQAHRVIVWYQQLMKERVLEQVKNMFLIEGIATGQIPYSPNWRTGAWHFPPAISIDQGRDSNAAIMEWRSGLMTKAQWYAEGGMDAQDEENVYEAEVDRTLATAQRLSQKYSIAIELALTLVSVRTPNGFYMAKTGLTEGDEPKGIASKAPAGGGGGSPGGGSGGGGSFELTPRQRLDHIIRAAGRFNGSRDATFESSVARLAETDVLEWLELEGGQ